MFRTDDKVAIFAEIYDNTGGKPHSLDVKAEVRSESGEVNDRSSQPRVRLAIPRMAAARYGSKRSCRSRS
jgi:hypothetical protein